MDDPIFKHKGKHDRIIEEALCVETTDKFTAMNQRRDNGDKSEPQSSVHLSAFTTIFFC